VFLFLIRATTVGATGLRQPSRSASGGRTWWGHVEFTRINIAPIILRKKVEELMNVKGIGEKSFLKLKPMVTARFPPGLEVGSPLPTRRSGEE